MTYNHNEKIGRNLILKARQTDLVHYLREKHPKSIQYASHPDAPDKFCWRGTNMTALRSLHQRLAGLESPNISAGRIGRATTGLHTL